MAGITLGLTDLAGHIDIQALGLDHGDGCQPGKQQIVGRLLPGHRPFGDGTELVALGSGAAGVAQAPGIGLPACLVQLQIDELARRGLVHHDLACRLGGSAAVAAQISRCRGALTLRLQPGLELLLQRRLTLAGAIVEAPALRRLDRKLERFRIKGLIRPEAAVEPDRQLARHPQRIEPFPITDAMLQLMGSRIAAAAQQHKELPDLRLQPETRVDRPQQFGLGLLRWRNAEPGGQILRDGFSHQPQPEHAARWIDQAESLGHEAQFGQQRGMLSQEPKVARGRHLLLT